MRHYLLHILGILIWVMFGAVGVGILWLIDLYTPLSLHLVDSKEGLILSFLGWCVSGATIIILSGPLNSPFDEVMRRIDRRWNNRSG